MFGFLSSVTSLAINAVSIVAAPVVMTVDLVNTAVEPLADVVSDMVDDIKSLKD